jgi:hypothetical protein
MKTRPAPWQTRSSPCPKSMATDALCDVLLDMRCLGSRQESFNSIHILDIFSVPFFLVFCWICRAYHYSPLLWSPDRDPENPSSGPVTVLRIIWGSFSNYGRCVRLPLAVAYTNRTRRGFQGPLTGALNSSPIGLLTELSPVQFPDSTPSSPGFRAMKWPSVLKNGN